MVFVDDEQGCEPPYLDIAAIQKKLCLSRPGASAVVYRREFPQPEPWKIGKSRVWETGKVIAYIRHHRPWLLGDQAAS